MIIKLRESNQDALMDAIQERFIRRPNTGVRLTIRGTITIRSPGMLDQIWKPIEEDRARVFRLWKSPGNTPVTLRYRRIK